ncbi:MAG: winged helix-turn-helix domain-containing protein [Bryobacteraceae bacterium]
MQASNHSGDVVQFGPFEVDLAERVIRRRGMKVRLQAQPFQVLASLLEKPGSVVTREELRQRLWTDDTFVDFEHGLNAAVTRLRQALGDSAERPRYIETVSKRGYRFTGSVNRREIPMEVETICQPPAESKGRRLLWLPAIFAAGAVSVFFLVPKFMATRVESLVTRAEPEIPLTAFRGIEDHPTLSPDGNQVAFIWDGEKQNNVDIYTKPIGSDLLLRITSDPAEDLSPTWSPDGRTIAFVRKSGDDRGQLLLIPASGGPEHNLHEIRNSELRTRMGRLLSLTWTPDGRWVAASHRNPGDSTEHIYLFSLTGEMRQFTVAPGRFGDHTPAFSPDGRTLAFSRLGAFSASEIYFMQLNSQLQPTAEPTRLTSAKRWSIKPVWLPTGGRILYLTGDEPDAPLELRVVSSLERAKSGSLVPLKDDPSTVSIGKHLVYSRIKRDTNIWRARIAPAGRAPSDSEPFISSTRRDEKPRYSPDGTKIAFISSRSGSPEVWVSNADGTNPARKTAFGGALLGYPNWSTDGQRLVFHARPEGQADLFEMPVASGTTIRLTTNVTDNTMPNYSPDGRWIYFASSHSGRSEIWKMPATGGNAAQLTTTGGQRPLPSADGKTIFYLALDGPEIRCVPSAGGPPRKVAAPIHRYPSGFDITRQGVYYETPEQSGEESFVQFLSFATASSRPVAVVHHPYYLGVSVSPDAKYVLFDQVDELDRDLLLIPNFKP